MRYLLLSDICGFVDAGGHLRREDRFVVYNCCWSLPEQSLFGPSPAGLMTIFYCLISDTPPTRRNRCLYLYPPGTGWPSYTPRYCVPFSSPPTTRRAAVEVFEPNYTRGDLLIAPTVLIITCRHGSPRKCRSSLAVSNCCHANMLVCEDVTE
jgi:hypothetical protein